LLNDIGNIDHAIKIAFNSIDGRNRDNAALFDKHGGSFLDDDNSTISKTEFRKLLLHSRGFHTGDDTTDDILDEHSKPISEELSSTVDAEVETFFMLLDTDQDGFLDRSEFINNSTK
jgi:Ca2+-binding EF-hand superfamily protein